MGWNRHEKALQDEGQTCGETKKEGREKEVRGVRLRSGQQRRFGRPIQRLDGRLALERGSFALQ